MNLHLDKNAFQELVTITSQHLGIEEIYIEKDYYVVLALKSLSESEFKDNGIFKGGTSLSKAYGVINRFSEDIDMAVLNDKGDDTGSRTKMKNVEEALTSNMVFNEDENHQRMKKGTRLRQTVHNYPILDNVIDFGQISKHIFIDVNRITPGIPHETRPITTYIYDYLSSSRQHEIIEEFELEPIQVVTIAIERTFVEKFGAVVKFASQNDGDGTIPIDRLKNGVRHIYDLHMLLKQERIQLFINGQKKVDGASFSEFVSRVLEDDFEGMKNIEGYSDYMNSEFANCLLYEDIDKTWEELRATYEGNFKRLLFQKPEPPTSDEIKKSLFELKELCHGFDHWKKENNVKYGSSENS